MSVLSHRTKVFGALLALGALALAGCASSSGDTDSDAAATTAASASSDAFPVTITHVYGETAIESEPQRVAVWGWAAADAALALGVVPVAIPAQAYGGDEEGVLPWTKDKLEEMGAETPIILDSSTGSVPIEQVAEADPDIFLAPYSGLTQEEYDLLTGLDIPVVAYPDIAWATPWRDVITITGKALGKSDDATKIVSDMESLVAEKAADNPEFAGKTVEMVGDSAGTFYVYLPADPRVEFVNGLGFENPAGLPALDNGSSTFYTTVSYEELDQVDADIVVLTAATEEEADTFLASDPAKLIPAVQDGKVAKVTGEALVASVSPPTALSLEWGIDEYIMILADTVK